jgi:hypothetical protein
MNICFKARYTPFASLSKDDKAQVLAELEKYDYMYLDDPLGYIKSYNELLQQFDNSGSYEYGTVGAMVVGCAQNRSPTAGCAPMCADALPYPHETDEINSHCMDAVVVIQKGKLKVLTRGQQTRGHILIYIDSLDHGISPRDMDVLYGLGQTVELLGLKTHEPLKEGKLPLGECLFLVRKISLTQRYVKIITFFLMILCILVLVYIYFTHSTSFQKALAMSMYF